MSAERKRAEAMARALAKHSGLDWDAVTTARKPRIAAAEDYALMLDAYFARTRFLPIVQGGATMFQPEPTDDD